MTSAKRGELQKTHRRYRLFSVHYSILEEKWLCGTFCSFLFLYLSVQYPTFFEVCHISQCAYNNPTTIPCPAPPQQLRGSVSAASAPFYTLRLHGWLFLSPLLLLLFFLSRNLPISWWWGRVLNGGGSKSVSHVFSSRAKRIDLQIACWLDHSKCAL